MKEEQIQQAKHELEQRWRSYYQNAEKPRQCILCESGRIWFNGSRSRGASVMVMGAVVYIAELLCRRVKCSECKTSWTLRPPEVIARKHYQLSVVSQALSGYLFEPDASLSCVAEQYGCSRQTVNRWVGWTAAIARPEICLGCAR